MYFPPNSLTLFTFIVGVVLGINIVPLIFNLLQENETPWAWFPALEQTTPLFFSSLFSEKILLYEPLILKDLVI